MSRTRNVVLLLLVASIGMVGQRELSAQQAADAKSPLLEEPASPDAMFDSVVLMVELARPLLARQYLGKLMAAQPDEATLLRLRDKHGPAIFLRLADLEYLQPNSVRLLERMNAAFRKAASDPVRVDRLIDDLQGSPAQRDVAVLQLRAGGALVVPRLVKRIRELNMPGQQELLQYVLVRLGKVVVPPLIAVLENEDPNLRATVIQVLGRVGDRSVAAHLWYYAAADGQAPGVHVAAREALARLVFGDVRRADRLDRSTVIAELVRESERHLSGHVTWKTGSDGKVRIWQYDSGSEKQLSEVVVAPNEATLYLGSRFAQQTVTLSPRNRTAQALFLSLVLARDRERTGWDQPLPHGAGTAHNLALLSGRDVLNEVLRTSMHHGNAAAAVSALEVMRESSGYHDLVSRSHLPSPLVGALNYPDRRVQYSSAVVIAELDPPEMFRGSPRVVEILRSAIKSSHTAHVVVSGPDASVASNLAGLFNKIGFRSLLAATGREAFKSAVSRDDVELVVLDANVVRWGLTETVANLRADARTAMIPIAVVGTSVSMSSVERLRRRYPLMTYLIRPADSDSLNSQVGPFLKRLRSRPLTAREHAQRSAMAVSLLGFLAQKRRGMVFDVRPAEAALFDAVNRPGLADDALFALAAIPTGSTQGRLADLVLQETLKQDLRVTAAAHLAFHIRRHGLLLKRPHLNELRTTYVESETPEIKSALAVVLSTLSPDVGLVGRRLGEYGVPRPR